MDQNSMGGFAPMPGQEPMPQNGNDFNSNTTEPMSAPEQNFWSQGVAPQMPDSQSQMRPTNNSASSWGAQNQGSAPQSATSQMPSVAPLGGGQAPQLAMGQMPAQGGAGQTVAAAPAQKSKNAMIEMIVLVVVCLIAAIAIIAAVVFFMRWNELSTNFEAEKNMAVAEAENAQIEICNISIDAERKKEVLPFTGPTGYGRVGFNYPKSWNAYEAINAADLNSDYEAYFYPGTVPSLSDTSSRYALRFRIVRSSYDDVVSPYNTKVREGVLKSEPVNYDNNKINGTKYVGSLEEGIEGIIVIATVESIGDKTFVLQTDSMEYEADFAKVLSSLQVGPK